VTLQTELRVMSVNPFFVTAVMIGPCILEQGMEVRTGG